MLKRIDLRKATRNQVKEYYVQAILKRKDIAKQKYQQKDVDYLQEIIKDLSKEDLVKMSIAEINRIQELIGKEAVVPLESPKKAINKVKVFDENHQDMIKGKEGEKATVKMLTNHKYKVYDMADDQDFRNIDTDFVVEDEKGNRTFLETKSSSSPIDTGFLIVELYNDITDPENPYQGWIIKCQSDYINVYSKSKKFDATYTYFYDTFEMKNYINEAVDYYYEAGIDLPMKWTKELNVYDNIPDLYTIGGFTNTEYKDKLKRNTTAHCLKIDINRYVQTGRYLEIVDNATGRSVYSTND